MGSDTRKSFESEFEYVTILIKKISFFCAKLNYYKSFSPSRKLNRWKIMNKKKDLVFELNSPRITVSPPPPKAGGVKKHLITVSFPLAIFWYSGRDIPEKRTQQRPGADDLRTDKNQFWLLMGNIFSAKIETFNKMVGGLVIFK